MAAIGGGEEGEEKRKLAGVLSALAGEEREGAWTAGHRGWKGMQEVLTTKMLWVSLAMALEEGLLGRSSVGVSRMGAAGGAATIGRREIGSRVAWP